MPTASSRRSTRGSGRSLCRCSSGLSSRWDTHGRTARPLDRGKSVGPAGGTYLPTVDPTTRQPGDAIAEGGADDIDLAVRAAADAQPAWGALGPGERGAVLHAVADAIDVRADELIALERVVTGKIDSQVRMEVDMSASYFRFYGGSPGRTTAA